MNDIEPSSETLTSYAREINATHTLAKTHAELAVVLAVRTGLLCMQAKAVLPHGGFLPWLDANCSEISHKTVTKYIKLCDMAKYEPSSHLAITAEGFTDRVSNDAGYREKVLTSVQSVVGDGSLNELYRNYGVLAPKQKGKSTRPDSAVFGIYTPHAIRAMFEQTLRQASARRPVDEWTANACADWAQELRPIAAFCEQMALRAKSRGIAA